MIADLKSDTERWEVERRTAASRGQPSNREPLWNSDDTIRKSYNPTVEYQASTTSQSRHYYGPTSGNAFDIYATQEGNDSVHPLSYRSSFLPAFGDQAQGYAITESRYHNPIAQPAPRGVQYSDQRSTDQTGPYSGRGKYNSYPPVRSILNIRIS